jgi:sugar/nucleoside kinase (ribokinase family)
MSYQVLGLGQPLLDRILQVDESVLQRLGFAERGGSSLIHDKEDLETFLHELSDAIQDSFSANSSSSSSDEEDDEYEHSPVSPYRNIKKALIVPGGSCCNTIKGIASLGEKCGFIGKIGRDSVGQLYKDSMSARGVIPLMTEDAHQRTGEVVCLISPNGERTMKAFLGASLQMTENDLLPQDFAGAKLLHVEGYAIYNQPLTLRAMQLAKQNNLMVSFDLGSFELVRQFKPVILDLLRNYVDIVFANSEEARELMGESNDSFASSENIAERCVDFLSKYCKVAVVMMGKKGCFVKSGNEKYQCPADVVPNPIDTTGAGDLFAAGFLYGYLQGYTLQMCARLGSLSGREVVKVMGAELSIDKFRQIKNHVNSLVFMNQQQQQEHSLKSGKSNSIGGISSSLKIQKPINRNLSDYDEEEVEETPIQMSGSFKQSSFLNI